MGFKDVDWIQMALDRDKWRALAYAVINISGSKGEGGKDLLNG
jgi:hypothetical protein